MTYTQHIKSLAKEHSVNLFWNGNNFQDTGFAVFYEGAYYKYPDVFNEWFSIGMPFETLPARSVVVPRPRLGTYAYWVCLHEIGHIACSHRSGTSMGGVGEVEAWRWAVENSKCAVSAHMRNKIEFAIRTHPDLKNTTKERHLIEHFCMRLKG